VGEALGQEQRVGRSDRGCSFYDVAVGAVTLKLTLPAHFLDVSGQREGFVVLGAFLISFLFIRTSARLMRSPKVTWWPGSVKTASGLHLHHLVWGIVLMMVAGFVRFAIPADPPWAEIVAGGFGVGMGLTLDEFALWIHLRDVYWAEEGRASFDAVVIATMLGGLIVCGVGPFDLKNGAGGVDALILIVFVDVLLAAVAIFKGRRLLGLVGIFIPLVSLVGAVRLAAPDSAWARRWYKGKKLGQAQRRWDRIRARRRRITDALAGAPSSPVSAPEVTEPAVSSPGQRPEDLPQVPQ
jgi:hypothetical protein